MRRFLRLAESHQVARIKTESKEANGCLFFWVRPVAAVAEC